MQWIKKKRELEAILEKKGSFDLAVEKKVREIISAVKKGGDSALLSLTKKYDGVELRNLRVKEAEREKASLILNKFLKNIIISAGRRIEEFHQRQLFLNPDLIRSEKNDSYVKKVFSPLEKVGIYIPAGTSPLISTVLMTVIPAKVAGVSRIILASPPGKDGKVNPYILAIASLWGVKEFYKIGGAQAIAALALGTETIPRVDKIIGPGNKFVTTAKRLLFGQVGIDLLAGPSEVLILADKTANPSFVETDLSAQSEHPGGLAILITDSAVLARRMEKNVKNGYLLLVKNKDEMIKLANKIAPEHLQIMTEEPEKIAKKIKNSGAVFLGNYSPAVIGDYLAGPSHVLPTGGSAKFFSGLSTTDFLRSFSIISWRKKEVKKWGKTIEKLAEIEGLPYHAKSIRIRTKQNEKRKN